MVVVYYKITPICPLLDGEVDLVEPWVTLTTPYRKHTYNQRTENIVREKYFDDIRIFDYSFE